MVGSRNCGLLTIAGRITRHRNLSMNLGDINVQSCDCYSCWLTARDQDHRCSFTVKAGNFIRLSVVARWTNSEELRQEPNTSSLLA